MDTVLAVSPIFERTYYLFEEERKAALTDVEKFAAIFDRDDQQEEEEKPYMVVNGVALYSIEGAMVDRGDWYTRYRGITDYETLADVASQMRADESVNRVLLRVSTPGGRVSGISDVGEVLQRLNKDKPITIHSASHIASAGMWLSSYADKIYGSVTAEFGSIGVIINHMSYQGALEEAGMKFTAIKSKPKKAMGSPYEDLSKEAKDYLQRKVDETDTLFEQRMREGRPGITTEAMNGEMFSAHDSVRLGLIDGIKSFSDTFKEVAALAAETETEDNPYHGGSSMKRKLTAEMASAAIETGADPDSIEIISQEVYDALSEDEKQPAEEMSEETIETEEPEQEAAEPEAEVSEEVLGLQEQIKELSAVNSDLEAKIADLELEKAGTDAVMAVVDDAKEALVATLKQRRVALGLSPIELSDLPLDKVMQEYSFIEAKFKTAFKVGGLTTKAQTAEEPAPAKRTQTGLDAARCASVGISSK